jgi:hypothetical protein
MAKRKKLEPQLLPEPPPDPKVLAEIKADVLDEHGSIKPGKSLSSVQRAARESKQAYARRIAWNYVPKALKTAVDLMEDSKQPGITRLKAANTILDRALGKPTQMVEKAIDGRGLFELTTQELVERLNQFQERLKLGALPEPQILGVDGQVAREPDDDPDEF